MCNTHKKQVSIYVYTWVPKKSHEYKQIFQNLESKTLQAPDTSDETTQTRCEHAPHMKESVCLTQSVVLNTGDPGFQEAQSSPLNWSQTLPSPRDSWVCWDVRTHGYPQGSQLVISIKNH